MADEALEVIRELEKEVILNPDNNLIIISFELPYRISRVNNPQRNDDSPLTEADFSVSRSNALLLPALHELRGSFNCNVKFIGFCGYTTENPAERKIIRRILKKYDCSPVFPTLEEFNEYVRFCFQFLSPIFHSIIHLDSKLQEPFNQHSWMVYQSMNKLWADEAVLHHTGDSDIVWVQDFHLLLVPQYLSRRYKRINIGLFLHVPFPACDVFRCLPVRVEIIRGMLCADLVGFHFFEYARHFFIVCKKLLGLDQRFYLGGFLGMEYGGHNVMVKIGHVNVEYGKMRTEILNNEALLREAKEIRQKYKGKIILGAVDKCDQLAGLSLKLRAIKFFVKHFPYAKNNVVLVQYAYPTRAVGTGELTQELLDLAERINSELGPEDPHIVLKIQVVPKEMKWALLIASDCLFDTSIRDGLNLTAFEYIACRGDATSHMILSEFTGCSTTLTSAKRINPWSLEDVAAKLDLVVSSIDTDFPPEKWTRDQNYLSQNSLEKWAKSYLGDLQRARKTSGKVYLHCGFASTYRVLSIDEDFRPLDVGNVVRSYRKANRRFLCFDHEGTLAPDRRHLARCYGQPMDLSAMGTPPSPRVRESLTKLCQDPDNVVVIFSGRDRNCLEQWFGDIPNLSLCAEHGYFIRSPILTQGKWECLAPTDDFVWKQVAFELMSQYVERTQGSFLENKGSALVFQYRDADPDFGSWQAKQLAAYLQEFLFNLPVNVVCGKGYVEARISGVSKGLTAEYLLKNLDEFQFILCIGDDQSDEEMFAVLNRLGDEDLTRKRSLPSLAALPTLESKMESFGRNDKSSDTMKEPGSNTKLAVFSVTVGKKPSEANYFLNDPEEVSELLAILEDQTNLKKMLEMESDSNLATVNPVKFVDIIEKSRLDLDQSDAWRTTML